MTTKIIRLQNREDYKVWKGFQWLDQYGQRHYPKNMETRHLFYTLRMIWNHSAPEELKLKPYIKHTFSTFYTPEYMRNAIKALMAELSKRDDTELYLAPLAIMHKHITSNRKDLLWLNYQSTLD